MLGTFVLGTRGVKSFSVSWPGILGLGATGMCLFFFNTWLLSASYSVGTRTALYTASLFTGYLCLLTSGVWLSRLTRHNLMDDVYNDENESFMQETRLVENEYSINLPTVFSYRGRTWRGWANITNPQRGLLLVGSPGSGKSFSVVNSYIRQCIGKGYSAFIYDFKAPDLSVIAYNALLHHGKAYDKKPRFYCLNIDDPRHSHRCNPLNPVYMTDIVDAYESALVILLGLNRTWITRQGEFFTESAIVLLTAVIWFLRIYQNGRYCTLPHAIELLNQKYEELFLILAARPELGSYMSAFSDALSGGAQEQLQGQLGSLRIPLARVVSPALYWIMTGDDFALDLNNPEAPKIFCLASNPDRQSIYASVLSLYTSRMSKIINKKEKLKCAVIVDELPTIFFKGISDLLATARSNKIATILGMQDFSQLTRDYGEQESKVIQNICGNVIAGQVVGDTARTLSERFGKIVQQRQSLNITREDKSTGINTQLETLIPVGKISNLEQGEFVGSVAGNFGEQVEQNIFHAHIVADPPTYEKNMRPIPILTDFTGEDGKDHMEEIICENYHCIKADTARIVVDELRRVADDPQFQHLFHNNVSKPAK